MQTITKRNGSSADRCGVISAFLKDALAGGAAVVAELEAEARAAMLLGQGQGITHSKLFKRAKKALGIRSIRDGFGPAGEWFWMMPPHPGLEIAELTEPTSTNPPSEVINGAVRLESQLTSRIGVPREWIDGVATLNRHRAPAHVPLPRWLVLIDDCERFLDLWAVKAAAFGWNAEALFGCARAQPLAYLQVAGLLWVVAGRKLIKLHRDWAVIENPVDSSQHVMNRRHTYGAQITLPWRLR
jgi:hypothetical protein